MPHNFVRPFHFWCQKVLPLVFDDSLSYYEVLAKMRDYLNEAIKEINEVGGEFEGVKTKLTQLQTYVDEYFAGLDVNQAISDKLDDMVESGEMDAVVAPIFAAYATPLFAASVADMIATNFAYANYENNKIYTFNQNTGLYQTTGKEFGGVVSSVEEMGDNDKYYTLDSNGMLYSYDFPQASFVATGLTYGGYRYGVNAMRPISNVYVLTTDSHIYTWNGYEYVDSGVVYGLASTAFTWRKKLSGNDNITNLLSDGWYNFTSNELPTGLPTDMLESDGFVLSYSVNGSKRVSLSTNAGGSWFWDGEKWLNDSETGFITCADADSVGENCVLIANENTLNVPSTGILKTFCANGVKSQLLFSDNVIWFKSGINWFKITDEQDFSVATNNITANSTEITNIRSILSALSANATKTESELRNSISLIAGLTLSPQTGELATESDNTICDENNENIYAEYYVQKTDKTLTLENVAGDAKAIGQHNLEIDRQIGATNQKVSELNTDIEQVRESVETEIAFITKKVGLPLTIENDSVLIAENGNEIAAITKQFKTDDTLSQPFVPADAEATGKKFEEVEAYVDEKTGEIDDKIAPLFSINEYELTCENETSITTENGELITGGIFGSKTDDTLSQPFVPADAEATGKKFEEVEAYVDYKRFLKVEGAGISDTYVIEVAIYGELPLTKTNVNARCTISTNTVVYSGNCKLKVQGSSSLQNPEKNYTLTLPVEISLMGYTTNKWNLKCNYIDPSQIRNLLGAKIWQLLNSDMYTTHKNTITAENNDTITAENNDELLGLNYDNQICYSPFFGGSDGELCVVSHNDEFHGLYTIQLPKGEYMLGMDCDNNKGQFMLSVNDWNFTHINTYSQFTHAIEIEENSSDMTGEVIYEKLNAWIDALTTMSVSELQNTTIVNFKLLMRYILFVLYIAHFDGIRKNMILYSFDGGESINISVWDMDSTFGNGWTPLTFFSPDYNVGLDSNSLFMRLTNIARSELNAELVVSRERVLNVQTAWIYTNALTAKISNQLYWLDFNKWCGKGKTTLNTPLSIPTWAQFHDSIFKTAFE